MGAEDAFREGMESGDEPAQQLDCAYNLGVVLTELGRLAEAEAAYTAALALDKTHQGALLNSAALRLHAGAPRAAAALVAACVQHHPRSEPAAALHARVAAALLAATKAEL